jgi:hypothetical protein
LEGESYSDLLNAYQLKRAGRIFLFFEAQGDDFAYALHQGVEVPGLRVASAKGGDGGDEIAVLVLFDHDSKFPTGLHTLPRVLTLSRYDLAITPAAPANTAAARSIEATNPVYFF